MKTPSRKSSRKRVKKKLSDDFEYEIPMAKKSKAMSSFENGDGDEGTDERGPLNEIHIPKVKKVTNRKKASTARMRKKLSTAVSPAIALENGGGGEWTNDQGPLNKIHTPEVKKVKKTAVARKKKQPSTAVATATVSENGGDGEWTNDQGPLNKIHTPEVKKVKKTATARKKKQPSTAVATAIALENGGGSEWTSDQGLLNQIHTSEVKKVTKPKKTAVARKKKQPSIAVAPATVLENGDGGEWTCDQGPLNKTFTPMLKKVTNPKKTPMAKKKKKPSTAVSPAAVSELEAAELETFDLGIDSFLSQPNKKIKVRQFVFILYML